jgi:hypothetical protein
MHMVSRLLTLVVSLMCNKRKHNKKKKIHNKEQDWEWKLHGTS